MAIAFDANKNIRYNGTGKAYATTVGATDYGEALGHFDPGFAMAQTVSTEEMTDYSTAARGTLISAVQSTEPVLTIPLREQTEYNLQMALMGSSWVDDNQSAGSLDSVSTAFTLNKYAKLGKVDVFFTRLVHGEEAVDTFDLNETVTGGTSAATGKIKWHVEDSLVELINVVGTFVAGETITGGTSGTTAVVTSVQSVTNDVIVCNAASATTRYTLGTHYTVEPGPGGLRIIHATPVSPVYVSCSYVAISRQYMHGLATTSVERKVTFATDKDDAYGPRYIITFHKVSITLNGDITWVGDGPSILTLTGKILADDNQATGEKYYKIEKLAT